MITTLLAFQLAFADEPPMPSAYPAPPPQVALPEVDDRLRVRLLEHNTWRKKSSTASMGVLLGWSVANIGVGAVGWGVANDPEWVAFHQTNLAWNAINLSLAIPGLVGALKTDPASRDLRHTFRDGNGSIGSFALNTGLDVGWVGIGAWLWERGERLDNPQLVGVGRSMVIQGGWLLVFDAVNLAIHGKKQKQLFFAPEVGARMGLTIGSEF
jgi:hypothetical protein